MNMETVFLGMLPTIVAMLAILTWRSIKINEKYKHKYKGALTELGKARSKLNKSVQAQQGGTAEAAGGGMDLTGMTLEQAMATFGFDAKELNNPIVRPIAEKIFDRLKQGNVQNDATGDEGY